MNKQNKTRKVAVGAVVAAIYVALTVAQATIFPGSTSMAVQFRVSEAMTVLSLFSPSVIPGLIVGCFLANLTSVGALPVDMLFGSVATAGALVAMYRLRNIRLKGIPILSLLMPAVFNGIIIGAEIEMFFIDGTFHFASFLTQAGFVALGEIGVLFTLGLLLYKVIKDKNLEKYLF
ncbi:MAG: QueT transporter family protein [Acutalibacteraceae bacterium]|nr:QueT transporter family protein [Acutalibacteraceae bacterium]